MTDWAQSGRIDRYFARRVDPVTGVEYAGDIEIDGSKCSVTWAKDSDTYVSAVVNLVNDTSYMNVNGVNKDCMIRLYHGIKVDDVDTLEHPYMIGTFFNETAGTESKFGNVDRKLNCYSTLLRFTEDYLLRDYSFLGANASQTGNRAMNFIASIVSADAGVLAVDASMYETDPTSGLVPATWPFRQDVFFEVGENKAEVINTVAGWIASEIDVMVDGTIRIKRKIDPTQKQVKYTFESGRNCTYEPGIKWTDTRSNCYNRVIAKRSTDDSTQTAMAQLSDTSTGSFALLGRYKTKVVTTSDDATDLSQLAQDTLAEESAGQVYIEIRSVSIPELNVGDVVRYINTYDWITDEGINAVCEVVEKSCTLDIGCTTDWKLRVIG